MLPIVVKIGKEIVVIIILGLTRNFIGSVAKVVKASICSVTFIVANSAAIADETLPATIKPQRTGPNSLKNPIATIDGTALSAFNLVPPE